MAWGRSILFVIGVQGVNVEVLWLCVFGEARLGDKGYISESLDLTLPMGGVFITAAVPKSPLGGAKRARALHALSCGSSFKRGGNI